MIASKMPSIRLEAGDLKCKNGCDYFGNPQWQGYCSQCHRDHMAKQRRAEKEKASSATLPRAEHRSPEHARLAPHSSFSKFEQKVRQRQSETLKKANLLKFSVFSKKNSTDDHDTPEKRPEFKIPSSVFENMKRDFRVRFPTLTTQVDRDARAFVHSFIMDVIKCANVMNVDELSERVQRQYQRFMKHMESSSHFANVDADTKEVLMDFVEKHAMTYLHELPSVVFSPSGTDDERLDRALSDRIQQLSWVGERRLECRLASPARCRPLLYKAINELLGMDSAASPGGKLARVRRCCRHVLALCGAPASADDLLPALIFTVLKANPPRLVSNINFVTRFCNAQRLMTGEGGYYFTNLCCAVSFIENLTAESLNMDKKEFDCYMAMPASIGGSSWAAALSLCAELREAEEQAALASKLLAQAREVEAGAKTLADNADSFEQEIAKKVQDVLEKTPLEIKPRRALPKFGKVKPLSTQPLIELEVELPPEATPKPIEEPKPIEIEDQSDGKATEPSKDTPTLNPLIQTEQPTNTLETEHKEKLNILGFEELEQTPPKSPQHDQVWELKQTSSMELLTPSPLGFTPFDSRSIDELMTPDEFVTDHLAPGLSNINYDIDLSDFSGDNSIAEEAPRQEKDPFSPEGLKKNTFEPFAPIPSRDPFSPDLFDQFSLLDVKNRPSDPFELVPKNKDPFSPIASGSAKPLDPFSPQQKVPSTLDVTVDPFSPQQNNVSTVDDKHDPFSLEQKESSILDDHDSPTAECLLPTPILPQSSGKHT
ncbi:rabaptin-5-associated exchange factor for Rab5 isoform X2 [Choristoneura fumiferana]